MKFSETELKSLEAAPVPLPPKTGHGKLDAPQRKGYKKRQKKHLGHGAWKLVYADFVTVLMAFFIVVWVMLFDNVSNR